MRGFGIGIGLTLCACALAAQATTVRPEDTGEALLNPGMGLVHYHYSNRLWAYGMYSKPGDKDPLPGTSVVYLRVLWNDVEPQEEEVIDIDIDVTEEDDTPAATPSAGSGPAPIEQTGQAGKLLEENPDDDDVEPIELTLF